MAISQLEIRVAVLRVSVKWTRKFKNIQKIRPLPEQKRLKNIDNITKLDECPCQDSIQGLQLRKPVTSQWGHKSISTLAGNIGPCNLQLVLEQCLSFNQWDAGITAWPVVWTFYYCLTVFCVPSNQITRISTWDSNFSWTEDMYFWSLTVWIC